jgi:hypothetical protein
MRTDTPTFATTVALMLYICAGCSPSTETPSQQGSSRIRSDLPPSDAAQTIADIRKLNADITVETNRLNKTVISIDLSLVRNVTPVLRLVATLPTVDRLSLLDADLHSEDFALLRQMSTLRWLDLSNTAVTDNDLSFLEFTPRLEFLLLWGTGITDQGLPHVARLTRLQKLDLSNTKITGSGLQVLTELRDLLELYVEVPGLEKPELARLQTELPSTLIVP